MAGPRPCAMPLCFLLLLAGAAANDRELFAIGMTRVTDPTDAGYPTQAPGFSLADDQNSQKALDSIAAIASHTKAPVLPFSGIISRAWSSILILGLCCAGVALGMCYLAFFLWQYGVFGTDVVVSGQRYNKALGVIVGLSIASGFLVFYFGLQQQQMPGFKQIEDFQQSVSSAVNGILHAPSPPPAVSPAQLKAHDTKLAEAEAAIKQVNALKAQIAALQSQLAATAAANAQTSATAAPGATTAATTAAPQISALQQKLAGLRANAQAKAAAALPGGPTPAPAGVNSGYGATGYGHVGNNKGNVGSPCGTTPPAMRAPPVAAPPKVVNYAPPLGCECKPSAAAALNYPDHCALQPTLFNNNPVCVVLDPNCGGTLADSGLGNTDQVVMCIQAAEGGTPFTVSMDRRGTLMHLGFDIAPDTSLRNLIMLNVSDGLVGIWNSAHPDYQVKEGDVITEVNGQSGSAVALTQQIIQKIPLTMTVLSAVGFPIVLPPTAPVAAQPAVALPSGDCAAGGRGWGKVSICISNTPPFKPGSSVYHCPWESMMLMSAKAFGGCNAIKIDCTGTNFNSVLNLYTTHSNNVSHPPEGNLDTVKYAQCCVTHQCAAGPDCGLGFFEAGVSKTPWSSANPCGAAGCERRYSQTEIIARRRSAVPVALSSLAIAASIAGFALWLHRTGRVAWGWGAAASHVLLSTDEEDLRDMMDEEAPVNSLE